MNWSYVLIFSFKIRSKPMVDHGIFIRSDKTCFIVKRNEFLNWLLDFLKMISLVSTCLPKIFDGVGKPANQKQNVQKIAQPRAQTGLNKFRINSRPNVYSHNYVEILSWNKRFFGGSRAGYTNRKYMTCSTPLKLNSKRSSWGRICWPDKPEVAGEL